MEESVYEVWWASAGCLPDSDTPAFEADTLQECEDWLDSNSAWEYWESAGENSTYGFQICENTDGKDCQTLIHIDINWKTGVK
jgi:hypothetical protein